MGTEQLANEIMGVLDGKARQPENTKIGMTGPPMWSGKGVEIGRDIERLIQEAKTIIEQSTAITKQIFVCIVIKQ